MFKFNVRQNLNLNGMHGSVSPPDLLALLQSSILLVAFRSYCQMDRVSQDQSVENLRRDILKGEAQLAQSESSTLLFLILE